MVVNPFTDYDGCIHGIGERWTFIKTNFVPYDDGMTLHVLKEDASTETVYKLQWRKEEQAEIIENFSKYVERC